MKNIYIYYYFILLFIVKRDLIENLSLEEKNMEKNKKKEEVKSSIRKILKQKPGEKLMNTLYIV